MTKTTETQNCNLQSREQFGQSCCGMATKRLSPTANLLRNSRLFSLPPPLPRPNQDRTATAVKISDTATLPYPTHAAIETPQSSLSRGDWGLKRSLPLQSTISTSTPVIRVDAVDSIHHITEFRSSADHVLTLRKWQEMGIPISMPDPPRRLVASNMPSLFTDHPKSVFEADVDNTEVNEQNTSKEQLRWKYKGPWLAGESGGDFEDYINKKIKRRKSEFRQFLRERLLEKEVIARKREAMDNGEELEPSTVKISDHQFESYVKSLREGYTELNKYVHQFLDLPPSPSDPRSVSPSPSDPGSGLTSLASLYAEQGHPMTHPSAGLSYNRTTSYIQNHPILGPQKFRSPVLGRVVQPQNIGLQRSKAKVGVGGIVAEDSESPFFKLVTTDPKYVPGLERLDPSIPGGAKVWVQPKQAIISSQGKIKLHYERAEKGTVAIYEEVVQEEPLPEVTKGFDRKTPDLAPPLRPRSGSSMRYGLDSSNGRALPFRDDNAPDVTEAEVLNMLDPSFVKRGQ